MSDLRVFNKTFKDVVRMFVFCSPFIMDLCRRNYVKTEVVLVHTMKSCGVLEVVATGTGCFASKESTQTYIRRDMLIYLLVSTV